MQMSYSEKSCVIKFYSTQRDANVLRILLNNELRIPDWGIKLKEIIKKRMDFSREFLELPIGRDFVTHRNVHGKTTSSSSARFARFGFMQTKHKTTLCKRGWSKRKKKNNFTILIDFAFLRKRNTQNSIISHHRFTHTHSIYSNVMFYMRTVCIACSFLRFLILFNYCFMHLSFQFIHALAIALLSPSRSVFALCVFMHCYGTVVAMKRNLKR
jgi:hypothetical protein